MNNEEIQEMMQKLQDAGLTPEDIADGILWPLFREGKMSKEDLGTLCSAIGLELDEDFEKDEGPEGAGAEGVTAEEAEAAKEIGPDESKEEFENKLEDAKSDSDEVAEEKVEDEESDGDDEEEWEEAKKLFKL